MDFLTSLFYTHYYIYATESYEEKWDWDGGIDPVSIFFFSLFPFKKESSSSNSLGRIWLSIKKIRR